MITCPKCQNEQPDESAFCSSCGCSFRSTRPTGDTLIDEVIDGKYRIRSPLRAGGMGKLYLADHLVFDEIHALKVVHDHIVGSEEVVHRFLLEANLTRKASQRSAHIVYIHDFGHDDKLGNYIAMEYLQGESLSTVLKPGYPEPPGLDQLLKIMVQLCKAMQVAHEIGIIHRDLKPANIFLIEKDDDPYFAKVLDFGVARARQGLVPNYETIGGLVGTPSYMAPEQILSEDERTDRGWPFDGRVDIYALGIMLYKALTGHTPFRKKGRGRSSNWEVWRQHIEEQPIPPHLYRPDLTLPTWLSEIVLRALAKDPRDRFESMQEFGHTLELARHKLLQERPELAIQSFAQGDSSGEFTPSHTGASISQHSNSSHSFSPPHSPHTSDLDLPPIDPLGTPGDDPLGSTPYPFPHDLGQPTGSSFDPLPAWTPDTDEHEKTSFPKKNRPLSLVFLLGFGVASLVCISLIAVFMPRTTQQPILPSPPKTPPPKTLPPNTILPSPFPAPIKLAPRKNPTPSYFQTQKNTQTPKIRSIKVIPHRSSTPAHLSTAPPKRKRRLRRRTARPPEGCNPNRRPGYQTYRLRSLGLSLNKISIRAGRRQLIPNTRGCLLIPAHTTSLVFRYRPAPTEYYPCRVRLTPNKKTISFQLVETTELRPSKSDCSR